jgi:hypothetical protein
MAGIDIEQSQKTLVVPEHYRVEVAIALGRRAEPSMLPAELQEREQSSQRLPVHEIAYAIFFPQAALTSLFGESLSGGALAQIVVRSWGTLITLVGAMLVYGAFRPNQRPLILTPVVVDTSD